MAKKDYQILIYQILKKMHYWFFWNIKDLWKKKVTGQLPKSRIQSQTGKSRLGHMGSLGWSDYFWGNQKKDWLLRICCYKNYETIS